DIVTDANAVEAMKQAGGMKIRDKWILTSTGHKEIDTYRSVLLAIYRMKDSATKKEITDEFERVSGKKCTLTDHAIRRLIKEFADLKSGRWVFRGETLEELREQAGVGGEGGAAAGIDDDIVVYPLAEVLMKITMLGPKGAGKTTIANALAEVPVHSDDMKYTPTNGVRILEFETDDGTAVELWDVSGDDGEFDSCYRAVQNGCEGVILVYDPNQREQVKEVDSFWYRKHVQKHFVMNSDGVKLGYDQCMVLQTPRFDSDDDHVKCLQAVPASMERIGSITTIGHVAELEAEQIRAKMAQFLRKVASASSHRGT
ncbi:RAB, member RAS oncoprotein -like 5, variant 2, partial [Perkinsus olseni]